MAVLFWSEFSGFKNIYLLIVYIYVKKILYKIAEVSLTTRGGGKVLVDFTAKKISYFDVLPNQSFLYSSEVVSDRINVK